MVPDFVLHSSAYMSDESREEARAGIYEDCRIRILHAVQDRYYIPRLIVSALVFLVSYLFFSLVLRNGIPMVDELAISAAVCALVYVRMRRSVLSKGLYVDLCGQLQNTLSTLVETEDAGQSAIEAWYGRVSSYIDIPAMADHLANVEKADVPSLDAELPPRLVEVLKVYATRMHREYSSYLRHIRRSDGRADARLASLLRQSSVSDSLDLYLLCLFGQIL